MLQISYAHSQTGFRFSEGKVKERIKFKFINNLIIIPIEVNGVTLSFVLDTGVNRPILFNLTSSDSLAIKNVEEIYIRGLGEGGPIRAFKSRGNTFSIKENIYNDNQELYVVLDESINFSPRIGFPIHGIIGYDLFKDFVMEINYIRKLLRFYDPGLYRYKTCKKCEDFRMDIIRNKPYINGTTAIDNNKNIPVKLLIDSGSSDALWLFETPEKGIVLPRMHFEDFLGRGLSGSIYGERSRVKNLRIGSFTLNNAKVAFPNATSVKYVRDDKERDGTLGAEILKRFHVIFDYRNRKITLRKNKRFKAPFKYNMSGIELQHNGIRVVKELASNINGVVRNSGPDEGVKIVLDPHYKISLHPAFEVAEIREKSPAAIAGIKKGDVIVTVNRKHTYRYSLQEVSEMLNEEEGQHVRLLVDRNGIRLKFFFTLKKLL